MNCIHTTLDLTITNFVASTPENTYIHSYIIWLHLIHPDPFCLTFILQHIPSRCPPFLALISDTMAPVSIPLNVLGY